MQKMPSNEEACRTEFGLIRQRIPALAEKTWNIGSIPSIEDFEQAYDHTDAVLTRLLRGQTIFTKETFFIKSLLLGEN